MVAQGIQEDEQKQAPIQAVPFQKRDEDRETAVVSLERHFGI